MTADHLVMEFESLRLHAYIPVPGDPPTIGYGSTGPDIHLGMVWTPEQALARLNQDINRAAATLRNLITTDTTQAQFDAMLSLAYNVGAGALHGSHLIADHNAEDWQGAADQFPLWDHSHGKEVPGLRTRRLGERMVYLNGSPS